MIKTLLSVFGIFIVLTAVTTIAMNDFSPRHTLFLLADAILLTAGAKLMQEAKSYYRVMAAAMAVAILAAVLVYAVMIGLTRAVTREDMALIPHGEKLGKWLHLRHARRG